MKLRILHIEDDLMYYHLIKEMLRAEGIDCEIERVDTRGKVRRALRDWKFDLILCDYTIPSYSGMAALLDVRKENTEIPFIFVSGTIGEARTAEAFKLGATNYVPKDDLTRLAPAIRRAMREVEEHRKGKSTTQ